jgi:predicted DNA-binding transcriptional regulator AlpA
MAVDPDNRLVARGLEQAWEDKLSELEAAKTELERRLQQRPRVITLEERERLLAVGADLITVWDAPTTTPRDRKELLRSLIEEVIVSIDREAFCAHLTLRWKGGALSDIDVPLPRSRPPTIKTDDQTIDLVKRLAMLYPDSVIAGILNRQGRTTAKGHRFDANRVAHLRNYWEIPCFQATPQASTGEILTIKAAAAVLEVSASTLHRWLNEGLFPGEQETPGAPWRIRLTDELKARFTETAGEGFVTMQEATRALGVTRQTVLHRVKRGELQAAHVTKGGKTGLRIKVVNSQANLFEPNP